MLKNFFVRIKSFFNQAFPKKDLFPSWLFTVLGLNSLFLSLVMLLGAGLLETHLRISLWGEPFFVFLPQLGAGVLFLIVLLIRFPRLGFFASTITLGNFVILWYKGVAVMSGKLQHMKVGILDFDYQQSLLSWWFGAETNLHARYGPEATKTIFHFLKSQAIEQPNGLGTYVTELEWKDYLEMAVREGLMYLPETGEVASVSLWSQISPWVTILWPVAVGASVCFAVANQLSVAHRRADEVQTNLEEVKKELSAADLKLSSSLGEMREKLTQVSAQSEGLGSIDWKGIKASVKSMESFRKKSVLRFKDAEENIKGLQSHAETMVLDVVPSIKNQFGKIVEHQDKDDIRIKDLAGEQSLLRQRTKELLEFKEYVKPRLESVRDFQQKFETELRKEKKSDQVFVDSLNEHMSHIQSNEAKIYTLAKVLGLDLD